MREKLITYVDLLFAGAPNTDEIHQEILQNTLDRYDDLIDQGKSPEAAYRIAISGIGDINEILGSKFQPASKEPTPKVDDGDSLWRQILRAGAIFLYIISLVPLFILCDLDNIVGTSFGDLSVIGFCATICICAVATVLLILGRKKHPAREREDRTERHEADTPENDLRKSVRKLISTLGLVVYFIISFATGAWHITWVIFPLVGAVSGLVTACMDLKEAKKNEK